MSALKSSAHFVISNFNDDPSALVKYSHSSTIFDQSDDPVAAARVTNLFPNAKRVLNPGHSLANFFGFIAENYDNLPDLIALLKSNILDRHVTLEFFENRILTNTYTPLFFDPDFKPTAYVSSTLSDGLILEVNNSWYVDLRKRPLVSTYNQLLQIIYKDPIIPEWVAFAPGANYVVPRAQLLLAPRSVYESLAWLTSYAFFPPEAYLVERLMHTLFTAKYSFQPWSYSRDALIREFISQGQSKVTNRRTVRRLLHSLNAGRAYFQHHRLP